MVVPLILNGDFFAIVQKECSINNVIAECLLCPNQLLISGTKTSTGNFHKHFKRKHPKEYRKFERLREMCKTKKCSSSSTTASSHTYSERCKTKPSDNAVLSQYQYKLRRKMQRIADTAYGNSDVLSSLNELETALLGLDFNENENISFPDTPPGEDILMKQESPDTTSTLQDDVSDVEDADRYARMFGFATQNDSENLTKYATNGSLNGSSTVTSGSLETITHLQENPIRFHLSESPKHLSKLSTVSAATHDYDAHMPEPCKTKDESDITEFPIKIEPGTQCFSAIPNTSEISSIRKFRIPKSSVDYPDPFAEATASLTSDEWNILFPDCPAKRKEDSDKPRCPAEQKEGSDKPRKRGRPVGSRTREKLDENPKNNAQENLSNRQKKVVQKTKPKILKEVKGEKKRMSSRVFRKRMLTLLTEANEMEQRRIAITETKVQNQTDRQTLEITRMNLEIMKLQKEIILLEYGGRILA